MTMTITASSRVGPLTSIRVLDLGTMVAGPVAATLLADFGAEVIKVEQPGSGDTLRGLGPFLEGESLWWNVESRNKMSITLNLRESEGQEILKKLVESADVVVENFRPGTLDKWGLGYSTLSEINPGLVMLSVSGFGQTGPYAMRAGYDRIALAFSGVMGITGFPDRPPVRVGVSVADYSTATMGAFAVMMALYHRDRGEGKGQWIDLALYETIFRFTDSMAPAFDKGVSERKRTGNIHQAAAPGDTFETADGKYLILTVSGDSLFTRLCQAIGAPQLASDPAYSTHEKRFENILVLNGFVSEWIGARTAQEAGAVLDRHGIPYSPVLTIHDIFDDPHFRARENLIPVSNVRFGSVLTPGIVPKLSETPGGVTCGAPHMGEHNEDVFQGLLGLSAEQMETLRRNNII
jgi:crotonobetainyl-CoA:carnitine CoA-transferase CaiB-like acyl-CoA transferase